jgi:hypothetical protein
MGRKMNKKVLNEINDIKRMMGIKPKQLISEQLLPPVLTKKILYSAGDEIEPVLGKFFNLADDEISDIANRIRRSGADNIEDDVIELLVRRSKDDISAVAKLLRVGGYLPEIETITQKIYSKVDEMAEVTAEQRDTLVLIFEDSLEQLGYISDGLKDALVREFRSDLQLKISPKFVIPDLFDDLLGEVEEMVTIPRTTWDKILGRDPKVISKVEYNLKQYENAMKQARKKGISLQNYTLEDWNKLVDDFKSNSRSLTDEQRAAYNKIYENSSFKQWYQTLSPIRKVLFWLGAIGVAPTLFTIAGYFLYKRLTSTGDIQLAMDFIDWIENLITGKVNELTERNVKEKIIEDFIVDEGTFNDEYTIYINDDKQSARVRGPQNFKAEINSDGKIIVKKTD